MDAGPLQVTGGWLHSAEPQLSCLDDAWPVKWLGGHASEVEQAWQAR